MRGEVQRWGCKDSHGASAQLLQTKAQRLLVPSIPPTTMLNKPRVQAFAAFVLEHGKPR